MQKADKRENQTDREIVQTDKRKIIDGESVPKSVYLAIPYV